MDRGLEVGIRLILQVENILFVYRGNTNHGLVILFVAAIGRFEDEN